MRPPALGQAIGSARDTYDGSSFGSAPRRSVSTSPVSASMATRAEPASALAATHTSRPRDTAAKEPNVVNGVAISRRRPVATSITPSRVPSAFP